MSVRRMVGHKVENDPHAAGMRRRDQPVEIGKRAENRIDGTVIGHVIAEIGHRREEDRRDPDCIDAESRKMIEPRGDAIEIPDAIAIAVLKRARIDLIDHTPLPPAAARSLRHVGQQTGLVCRFAILAFPLTERRILQSWFIPSTYYRSP